MNNDDLLARLRKELHAIGLPINETTIVVEKMRPLLSPVLSEDVQTMSADLRHEITNIVPGGDGSARYSWPTVAMNQELMQQQAADLIERLARENELLDNSNIRHQEALQSQGLKLDHAKNRIGELELIIENYRLDRTTDTEGAHSCGPDCERPLCVANRKIAEYEKALDLIVIALGGGDVTDYIDDVVATQNLIEAIENVQSLRGME